MSDLTIGGWVEVNVLFHVVQKKWCARGGSCTAYGDSSSEACEQLSKMLQDRYYLMTRKEQKVPNGVETLIKPKKNS